MADPKKYVPSYNYSDYQAANPTRPLPAPRIDIDLEDIAESIGQTIDGLMDLRRSDGELKRIVGPEQLKEPLFTQFQELTDEAIGAANRADNAANAAKNSENNSKASENKAKASETAAATSAVKAKTSENNAKASETAAATSADKAKTSEDNAKASETAAAASADKAKTSEDNAKASETAAASSASAAATSEGKAKASETAAATSATNAKTSEDNAKASETAAATSATNAKTSEDNAKASETAAASSASAAATSEGKAKASETAAAGSADSASTSASNASGSAQAAASSANAASTSEGNAKASETAAATSATNAKTSEDNAADSAAEAAHILTGLGGGAAGQALIKRSADDYDYEWEDLGGGGDMLKSVYDPDSTGTVLKANEAEQVKASGVEGLDTVIETHLESYYTKSETDTEITTKLTGYYTKAETETAIETGLEDYYTKSETETIVEDNAVLFSGVQNLAAPQQEQARSNIGAISADDIPAVPVTSVAGKTGDVTLNKNDVGLNNVANKTEAQMVASGAIADALGDKVKGDFATTVGFNNGNLDQPYIRKSPTELSFIATKDDVDDIVSWPGVYTGSDTGNTNFPIGTYISFSVPSGVTTQRNQAITIRLSAANNVSFTIGDVSGPILSGLWRQKGTGMGARVS